MSYEKRPGTGVATIPEWLTMRFPVVLCDVLAEAGNFAKAAGDAGQQKIAEVFIKETGTEENAAELIKRVEKAYAEFAENGGSTTTGEWMDMRFPGILVDVLQDVAGELLAVENDGTWKATAAAEPVMKAFVTVGNPGDSNPDRAANLLVAGMVNGYNKYVQQKFASGEATVLWIP